MVYLFLLELLIHRLGDPKCVVWCSDMSVVIRYFMVSVRRTGTFLVILYYITYHIVLYYITLHHIILYIMLYHAILCYIILYIYILHIISYIITKSIIYSHVTS